MTDIRITELTEEVALYIADLWPSFAFALTGKMDYFSISQAQFFQETATKYKRAITVTITQEKADGTPYDTIAIFVPGGTIDTASIDYK